MITSLKLGNVLRGSLERTGKQMKVVAVETRQSKQILSDYLNNRRNLPIDKAKKITESMDDPQLNQELAALFFKALAPRTTKDLSSENVFLLDDLKKFEEQDRVNLEEPTLKALMVPMRSRSVEQERLLKQYAKEFLEEIASELVYYLAFCKDADLDATEMIEKINVKNLKG